jgi:SAM-dependent methyltransferase
VPAVDGYDETTYGRAFADVYDDWYADVSDVETTVADLVRLAGSGPVLELGVGTGRLAIPLAELADGVEVVGVDTSDEMLARLRAHPHPASLTARRGDMVDGLPDGPFTLVFVAYNTIFNLVTAERQQTCFAAVADRLTPGGRFVVEAFVPDEPPRDGDHVEVRTLAADRVVLSISRHEASSQRAEGQFVELTEHAGVRLRPWSIRYASPSELDAMAAAAGLELESRWEAFGGADFRASSTRHVTVYRRP